MKKAAVLSILFVVVLLAVAVIAEAQQPKKVPLIGRLGASDSPERTEAFRQGLRELGYVEGRNINIEHRNAEGKFDRLVRCQPCTTWRKHYWTLQPWAGAKRKAIGTFEGDRS